MAGTSTAARGGSVVYGRFCFWSPSAAAAAVLGQRANGWTEWKDKDNKTIDEIYRIENILEEKE